MAAPHMTGLAALVEQYVQESLQITSKTAASSSPVSCWSAPRCRRRTRRRVLLSPAAGAGLVNAAGAVTTPAYISVAGQNVGKLELKDDPEKTGRYTMNFEVHNLTDEPLTYTAKAAVLRPDTGTAESRWGEASVMLDSDVLLREVDLGTVTVPASGSVQVSKTVTLSQEEKALLDSLFANGAYVRALSSSPTPPANIRKSACLSWPSTAIGPPRLFLTAPCGTTRRRTGKMYGIIPPPGPRPFLQRHALRGIGHRLCRPGPKYVRFQIQRAKRIPSRKFRHFPQRRRLPGPNRRLYSLSAPGAKLMVVESRTSKPTSCTTGITPPTSPSLCGTAPTPQRCPLLSTILPTAIGTARI